MEANPQIWTQFATKRESICSKCSRTIRWGSLIWWHRYWGVKCPTCYHGKDPGENTLTIDEKREIQSLKDRISALSNLAKPLSSSAMSEFSILIQELSKFEYLKSIKSLLKTQRHLLQPDLYAAPINEIQFKPEQMNIPIKPSDMETTKSDTSETDTSESLLRERFGMTTFRPGQKEVIDALLSHGSALAVFPTGAGKSLCYQLPALLFDGVTIVISPLIALMKDQIDFLRANKIEAARLDSTLSLDETRDVARKISDGSLRLLYVAPERFNNERFLAQLQKAKISLFAIDEAHCISEWGHNFRPDYLKLAQIAKELKVERILALTATATPSVVRDICAVFDIPDSAAIVTGFERKNLFLSTAPVALAERTATLISRLKERPRASTIVYVTLQATAKNVAEALSRAGLSARAYHAGMKDEERTEVQEWWKQSAQNIVVATIAFGMGIDKADVRYVYHYNLPKGLESYSQEVGRAGRDGQPSIVEILGGEDDVVTLENFAYGDTPTRESVSSLLQNILARQGSFDVSSYSLSSQHDIRPLVLRTALTYLELLQALRQGTPFYAEYKVRLNEPLRKLLARFPGERAEFVKAIFENSKFGREWYTIDPESLAGQLGHERDRVVKAIDYIGEKGWAEIQVSDARQQYTCLLDNPDIDDLVDKLMEKFLHREKQEAKRIQQVIQLISNAGCQTNFLLDYFGEVRDRPCGHCSYCESLMPTCLVSATALPEISAVVDKLNFESLCNEHHNALAHIRQRARFLCGLSSPSLTKAKLTKHKLFGVLEKYSFSAVLNWLQV